jgi:pimeloyl-ACP methyl ester carboxylesterase
MANGTNVHPVVLVHGGFADASFWTPVIQELPLTSKPCRR